MFLWYNTREKHYPCKMGYLKNPSVDRLISFLNGQIPFIKLVSVVGSWMGVMSCPVGVGKRKRPGGDGCVSI